MGNTNLLKAIVTNIKNRVYYKVICKHNKWNSKHKQQNIFANTRMSRNKMWP